MEKSNYQVHPKENVYFLIKLFISIFIYGLIACAINNIIDKESYLTQPTIIISLLYGLLILLWLFFSAGIMAGHVKGNGIRITEKQFPEIYKLIEIQCNELDIEIPPLYVMQNGGVLNAFATRFVRRNYVVVYSDMFDLAHEDGLHELSFIIAHELGHIKRNHAFKKLALFPSFIIPFLGTAYSRACEYTCDNIAASLSPMGSFNGLMILAAGKRSYKEVDMEEYIRSAGDEWGFWKWFSEKVSSHPTLPNRIENIRYSIE